MSNINGAYFSKVKSSNLSEGHQDVGEVCIANISPLERKIRLTFAIWQFVITLVILAVMIALHLNPAWRLLLFFLFSASTSSFFQSRDKTWVLLASRGARKFGEFEEKIEDQAELKQVRRQALRVIFKGTLAALPLTILAYLLPF